MRRPRLATRWDAVNLRSLGRLTGALLRRCETCRGPSSTGPLCAACLADLPLNRWGCIRCAEPFPTPPSGPVFCAHCLTQMPAFDRVLAPLLYAPPVSTAIQALKFRQDISAGRRLADWLHRTLPDIGSPDLAIPVPLHAARTRERGFNQALEIARPLCRRRGWTLVPDGVRRVRSTAAQTRLDAAARRRNLRNAFALNQTVEGARVFVIDDVVTTGATTSSLAHALHQAGAADVVVIAAARTPHADSDQNANSSTTASK